MINYNYNMIILSSENHKRIFLSYFILHSINIVVFSQGQTRMQIFLTQHIHTYKATPH